MLSNVMLGNGIKNFWGDLVNFWDHMEIKSGDSVGISRDFGAVAN